MHVSVERFPRPIQTLLRLLRVDFRPRLAPRGALVLLAFVVALVGSLALDVVLVRLGQAAFPSTKGYGHFQFSDYAKLTVIGVVIASVGWPIAAHLTSTPRKLFCRLAVLITLVLFAPDAYIWWRGSPGEAVFVLLWLHVGIAIVTYNALVRLAPSGQVRPPRR